jgi:uncharacterized protein YijF (DUF1287 family)
MRLTANKIVRALGAALLIAAATATLWLPAGAEEPAEALVQAALARTQQAERYDGSYRVIAYPLGDVPDDVGVCTDLVIRAYRALGVDLQQRVHEDMRAHFGAYPNIWGLRAPDPNIDHRRVPNLQRFFERHGQELPVSPVGSDFTPGDIVTWMLPGRLPHIGIVTGVQVPGSDRPMIVHNIGRGPQLEDMLFMFEITGHYRYKMSP